VPYSKIKQPNNPSYWTAWMYLTVFFFFLARNIFPSPPKPVVVIVENCLFLDCHIITAQNSGCTILHCCLLKAVILNGARHLNIYINKIKYYLLTAIGLSLGGSCYFTCVQNMKLITNKFKSGGLHEKHVVATWNLGNHLSICL